MAWLVSDSGHAGWAVCLLLSWACTVRAVAAQDALGRQPSLQPHTASVTGPDASQMYIPRIIHQSYLPDETVLDKMSTAPRSHFRRDWRRSCQVHNPGYQYMFWNESVAQTFVTENYPHMLPYYNAVDKFVLKSDILRVMILDKLGGVWLDIDTECFAPVEPILKGFHMVAQAEWTFQLCNSHMAGIPKHPVWQQLMHWFIAKVKANVTDPLKHTGPVALTTLVKAHIQPANTDRNMSLIVGSWIDPDYPASKFRAYGLQEAWYLPCKWAKSYMSPCQSQLARSKAIVRQLANGVNVALDYAARAITPPAIKELVDTAKIFQHIRGSHEYANSWTKWAYSDGLKALIRSQEALFGLQPFFSTAGLFEEYHHWVRGGCGESIHDADAMIRFQVCPAVLRAAAAVGACKVLSIRGRLDQQTGNNNTLPLDMETLIAERFGCDVKVVSIQPRRQTEVIGRVTVTSEPMQLGPVYDQYSHPPTLTLPGLLQSVLQPNESLTLLHIDCGHDCRLWEVLNQLQLTGSLDLRRVGSLLVDLGPLAHRRRHMLNTVYQHLYQEIGLVGYSWGRSRSVNSWRRGGAGLGLGMGMGQVANGRKVLQDGGREEEDGFEQVVAADGGDLKSVSSVSRGSSVAEVGVKGKGVGQFVEDVEEGWVMEQEEIGGRSLQAAQSKGKRAKLWEGPKGAASRWLLQQQQARSNEPILPPLRLGFARVL